MGLYFLAALIMKPEPEIPVMSKADKGRGAIERLKRRYENMERRLRRTEDTVTTKEFDWNRRLNT
jgi:phage shock protein C